MKSLQTIQKVFKTLKIIIKVAEILCIVGASISALTVLCFAVRNNGGHVFSIFGTSMDEFFENNVSEMCGKLVSYTFMLTSYAIVLGFAQNYLKTELIDGTPFTEKGAVKLKMLGIRCIYIPIVAAAISELIIVCCKINTGIETVTLPSVIIGAILIIVSLIFQYGTELENKGK